MHRVTQGVGMQRTAPCPVDHRTIDDLLCMGPSARRQGSRPRPGPPAAEVARRARQQRTPPPFDPPRTSRKPVSLPGLRSSREIPCATSVMAYDRVNAQSSRGERGEPGCVPTFDGVVTRRWNPDRTVLAAAAGRRRASRRGVGGGTLGTQGWVKTVNASGLMRRHPPWLRCVDVR